MILRANKIESYPSIFILKLYNLIIISCFSIDLRVHFLQNKHVDMPARKYLISDVALQCNCSTDLLRKLESAKKIPPARRSKNGYRYFSESELKKIKLFFSNRMKKTKWDRKDTAIQGKLFDD